MNPTEIFKLEDNIDITNVLDVSGVGKAIDFGVRCTGFESPMTTNVCIGTVSEFQSATMCTHRYFLFKFQHADLEKVRVV